MQRADLPAALTTIAGLLLPAGRRDWASALTGELAELESPVKRWRFAINCLRVAVTAPASPGSPGRQVIRALTGAAVACVAMVGYALARYPDLRSGTRSWLAVLAFLLVLAGYLLAARLLVARLGVRSGFGTSIAAVGAALVGALWIGIGLGSSSTGPGYLSLACTIALAAVPICLGWLATRRTRSRSAGIASSLLCALLAGLAVFLSWTGDTLLTAGRPYDPGLIRDFHSSGAHDLASYAVNDNLGSAMMLLLLVPLLTAILGYLGSMLAGPMRASSI